MAPPREAVESHRDLRAFLVDHFNDGELRDLCFDLNIDYESLPAQTKSGKARELIAYCRRYSRYEELVAEVRVRRPNAGE